MQKTFEDALRELRVEEGVAGIPGDPQTTNRLLLENLRWLKIVAAANGTAFDWDVYMVVVGPGATPTKLLEVVPGEEFAVLIANWDRDDGKPVYYDQSLQVIPSDAGVPTAGEIQTRVGFPLNAGDFRMLLCRESLYAVLDTAATWSVPIHVQRTAIKQRAKKDDNLGEARLAPPPIQQALSGPRSILSGALGRKWR